MTNPVQGVTTTTQMVADLQQRIPMNLSSTYCMLRLNQAYQWIEQQGAFVWNILRDSITLGALATSCDVPDTMDVGKPWSIYPWIDVVPGHEPPICAEIPYVPMDEIANHQIYHLPTTPTLFSCHTLTNSGGLYKFRFAPSAAADVTPVPFMIHFHQINPAISTPLTVGASKFPTPPAFDQVIVDLAEAEVRRIYRLSGWSDNIAKAQASAQLELDKYRSPKRDLAGLTEQSKEVQEKQLNQAQAG